MNIEIESLKKTVSEAMAVVGAMSNVAREMGVYEELMEKTAKELYKCRNPENLMAHLLMKH